MMVGLIAESGGSSEIATLDADTCDGIVGDHIHCFGRTGHGFSYSASMVEWIKNSVERFDVVVVHGLWQFHSLCGPLVCLRRKVPYLFFPHGMLDPWFRRTYPFKHVKKQIFWLAIQGWLVRRSAAVVFTTEREKDKAGLTFWPGLGESIARILPLSINDLEKRWETGWNVEENRRPYILFIGRLHPKKQPLELAEVYTWLRERLSFDLVIAGPAEDIGLFERLQNLAREDSNLRILGPLYGQEKWRLIAGATALILPSLQENFGVVVVEALALGKPVLLSSDVDLSDTIERWQAGLVAGSDREGIQNMLLGWENMSSSERCRASENAKACFEAEFAPEAIATKLSEVLHEFSRQRNAAKGDS